MRGEHVLYQSSSDEWATPQDIFDTLDHGATTSDVKQIRVEKGAYIPQYVREKLLKLAGEQGIEVLWDYEG